MAVSELTLKQNALLAQADPADIAWLAGKMSIVLLKRRETLGIAKGPFVGLGLVLSGRLQALDLTLDGREVALQTAESGDLFGEENPFCLNENVQLQWVAAVATELAVLDGQYGAELKLHPSLVLILAEQLARQRRDQLQWQKIANMGSITAKVCALLIHQTANTSSFKMPTHSELAWRLGTSRESITRVLQRLQATGALKREGAHWLISKLGVLRDLATREDRQ